MQRPKIRLMQKGRSVFYQGKPKPEGAKKRRWKAGTVALREIRFYQKSTDLLIQREPFTRLVREIAHNMIPDLRFTATGIQALQYAAEDYLTTLFRKAQLSAVHGRRIAVTPMDIKFTRCIRDEVS